MYKDIRRTPHLLNIMRDRCGYRHNSEVTEDRNLSFF